MFHKIPIANDGCEGAARALSAAIKLTKLLDAELRMISVEEMPASPAWIDEIIEEKQEANPIFEAVTRRSAGQAQAEGRKLKVHIVVEHPVSTMSGFGEREGVDLLEVGYIGHSLVYNRSIGSMTERLVEQAPCAVLVVK
jgi:nucleotide-binding universal stress UspA family protein